MIEELLPDQLKTLWQTVDAGRMSSEEFHNEQERRLGTYRDLWAQALLLEGFNDLKQSILAELSQYFGCNGTNEVELRCTQALADVKGEWDGKVDGASRESVERFYDKSQAMIFELMWWHTLCDDASPLAYVVALKFAERHGCRSYLDFGAGVGSGAILFARNGFDTTLADISTTLLDFCRYRFESRNLKAHLVDLKKAALPSHGFDMVAAMDVFEHLVDPVRTVDELSAVIKPGGFLFGRFHAEVDEERPHHIVQDFGPTLERLREHGFVEAWRDEWLWGHQVFQKQH